MTAEACELKLGGKQKKGDTYGSAEAEPVREGAKVADDLEEDVGGDGVDGVRGRHAVDGTEGEVVKGV